MFCKVKLVSGKLMVGNIHEIGVFCQQKINFILVQPLCWLNFIDFDEPFAIILDKWVRIGDTN